MQFGSNISLSRARAFGSPPVAAAPVPVTISGVPEIDNTAPEVGDLLTAIAASTSGDKPVTTSFEWRAGGTLRATASTYTVQEIDVALTITVEQTSDNAANIADTATSLATDPVPALPVPVTITSKPEIDKTTPRVGDTLTAITGTTTGDAPITTTFEWRVGGTLRNTALRYTVQEADEGLTVVVRQVSDNASGPADTADSAPTSAVVAAPVDPPVISGVPTISNTTPKVGDTLTVTSASATGSPSNSYAWQNAANDSELGTGTTYVVQGADEGIQIQVVQTATNAAGIDTATSAATDAVTIEAGPLPFVVLDNGSGGASILVPEGGTVSVVVDGYPAADLTDVAGNEDIGFLHAPTVSGTPEEGDALTIDLGVVYYEGAAPVTITQDIQRDGVTISVQADIRVGQGPQTYNYTIVAADLGTTLTLRSTLTNGANTVIVDTPLGSPLSNPILRAGASGYWDFSDETSLTTSTAEFGDPQIVGATDLSGNFNDLSQASTIIAPRVTTGQVNGRTMARFEGNDVMRCAPQNVREFFLVVSNLAGDTAGIAPFLGSHYDDSGATHNHIFARSDGQTDYDVSLDGTTSMTGTARLGTGQSATGENGTFSPAVTPVMREGPNIWYVQMDADIPLVDAVGALRSGFGTYRNDSTLFGEVVFFDAPITAAQANSIGNYLADKWGLTWSDI